MRGTLLLLAKAATSILLLYFSLRWVNASVFAGRLSRFDPSWIALALFLLIIQVAFLAVRWRTIAAACGASLAFTPALQLSFIATFFNQVLPSTVGGDGVRIWLFARKGAGWARATYSVLIDQIVAYSALAIIVIACLPWTFELIHDPIARAVLLIIGFGAVVGTSVFIMIGTHFQQIFESMGSHAALVGSVTSCRDLVRLTQFDQRYPHVLDRSSFSHHRRGVVLHKDDRCTRHFPAGPIPYASGPVDFDHTDIDRRLGCPRKQHDCCFRVRGACSKRRPYIVHPLWCDEFCRRRHRRDRVDRERLAGAIV